MDRLEGREQVRALEELANLYDKDHRFAASDVCQFHRNWLGRIYSWAGQYRQINVTKDGFTFAAAAHIPKLMADLENGPLRHFTPCGPATAEDLARSLAVVHVELILIHPFREGNGRVGRLLAVLMGLLQAGLPPLYFDKLSGRKREQYFAAVRAGLELCADDKDVYRGDREDFADSRTTIERRAYFLFFPRSDLVSLTPSISVEVETLIWNISRRLTGSARYGFVFFSERFSMSRTIPHFASN